MKQRRGEVAMLKEAAKKNDVNGSGGLMDLKEEVKDEVKGRSARSTPDSKPPSNKMANGEADTPKSEDNNKNKIKSEGIKEENGGPMSVGSDMKKSPAGAGVGAAGPASSQSGPSGPMSESMPGFIQQQSRIFVFSTHMANKAAESVKMGQFKSMIQFHMEQPTTKQYLQKNPVKHGQYGRPPTSMPMYSQYPGQPPMMGKPGMGPVSGPGPGPGGNYMPGMGPESGPGGHVAQWVQQQNANLQEQQVMGGMPPYSMSSSMGPGGPGPRPMGWSPQGIMQGPGGPMGGPGGGYGMMDSSFEFNPDSVGPGGSVPMPHMNLSQNKVPNENLTPEQLERREEQLANLRKIGAMLFAGDQNPMDSPSGGNMYMGPPGAMSMGRSMAQQQSVMTSQHQAMMSQHQAMMGGPGPGPHPGMMSPSQQYMMQQQQQSMGMGGPGPYPPGHPGGPRMQGPGMPPSSMSGDMNPQQMAWMQMQHEFYEKKSQQMRSQQAMMGGMGPGPQHPMDRGPMNGPPPPYYSTMGGKRPPGPMSMVGSPTSPNPMMEPGDPMGMFPSMRRPGMPMDPQGMDGMGPGFGPSPGPMSGPGMPPHSMGGMGMGMPGMDPMMGPGMGPGSGPGGPQGPMAVGRTGPGGMLGGGSGVNVVSSTSGRKSAGQVTLHRAGNPEQFTPDPSTASLKTAGSKPPPSYAQAQKRKRDDLEDAYKHLQPTPSPTQLNYLNQFDGQELTITKQLNTAFRDPTPGSGGGDLPPSSHPHNTQFSSPASNSNPVNSPLPHGSNSAGNPPSVKGPMSNSSQTSSTGHLGSPGSLHHPPGPSPMSGANMRLTHYDPAPSGNGSNSNAGTPGGGGGMSSAPATPTTAKPASMPTSSSSSMSNITSASLANLAKGVEHLSNQMQQNMMQGGPFHSIQVQGQMSGTASNSNTNGSNSSSVSSASSTSHQQSLPITCQAGNGSQSQSVNNTYLSTNLQIGQVNIQNVTAGSNANMQVQQMTAESPHMSMAGGGMTSGSTANGAMGPGQMGHPMSHHMHQQQAMMMGGGPGGMAMSQSQHMSVSASSGPMASMPPSTQVKSPPYSTPHPIPHPSMSTGMHQGAGGNRLASPPFPPSSVGNANVQIQPKAPNTIQYLPANPPPTQQPPQPGMVTSGGPPPAKRMAGEMDFMPRYSSPMDMKNPSSTLQYFPGSPNHGMRHPSSVGPSGPMSEFTPQQTMEMQQAMMMRGGGPPGPGPQDYGPMGPMGQGMHPGMSMGPGGPVPPSVMGSPPMGMETGMRGMEMGPGMGSPMDPMMMGPSPSAMRQMSALGPGGSMDPMSPMPSMMGPGGPPSGPYPGGAPSGYMPNGQSMMMSQGMSGPGPTGPPGHPGAMAGMPGGMARMPGGPASMRIPMQPGPGQGPTPGSTGFQQFQQQLYSQGRPRQMSPMHMMGAGPPGPGQPPYMGMMPPT